MKNAEIEHKTEYNLMPYNTLRISSIADDVYFPKTHEEFSLLLANLDLPLVIGKGSNLLLSSFGIKRPVIITKNLNKINVKPPFIEADAGVSVSKLSNMALELKLTGFEFLSSIPATIGGAVSMNAGANGQEISDCFVSALVYDSDEDKIKTFTKEDMGFLYRSTKLKNQERYFVLSAKFELKNADSYDCIQELMNKNMEKRKASQPSLNEPNLGCVFKNVIKDGEKLSAGMLLDKCNLKSFPVGGAMVSHKHANFIINFNNATSTDYLCLMQEMQNRVKKQFEITLMPEVIYVGDDKKENQIWKQITQS